jgi:hypothetical protein
MLARFIECIYLFESGPKAACLRRLYLDPVTTFYLRFPPPFPLSFSQFSLLLSVHICTSSIYSRFFSDTLDGLYF